jgi:uncharacterized protein (DUF488 family)
MQPLQRPLKLPTRSARVQAENKALWNEARSMQAAKFFTIGYSGRTAEQFVQLVKEAAVSCVVDIRYTPVSMYKPDFSRSNFKRILEEAGVEYLHVPELGVPRDIRARAIATGNRDVIWDWYDQHVVVRFLQKHLYEFKNLNYRVALMCVEADPTECHRHRLFQALEDNGLQGYDL